MDILIDLLGRKNMFLEKFYTINEAELLNFESDDFKNLESFYNCRESLLNIINRMDNEIDNLSKDRDEKKMPLELKQKIQNMLDRKDDWAKRIVDQDLKIISCIEDKKSGIINELNGLKTSQKLLNAYDSKGSSRKGRMNEKV